MRIKLPESVGTGFGWAILLLIVALIIFAGPALLVWSLGAIMQGEGFDLNFWSWLGGFVFLFLVGGTSKAGT